MSGAPLDLFPFLGGIWQVISTSLVFTLLKWFLMIYTIVLFLDVVFLLLLRGIKSDVKTTLFGMERPLVTSSTVQKRWETIQARLEESNPSQYKVSILEADHMADELLAGIGYSGSNMGERLQSIHLGQLESYTALKSAHEVRNRIVHEKDFQLSRDEAREILQAYRTFFEELELF